MIYCFLKRLYSFKNHWCCSTLKLKAFCYSAKKTIIEPLICYSCCTMNSVTTLILYLSLRRYISLRKTVHVQSFNFNLNSAFNWLHFSLASFYPLKSMATLKLVSVRILYHNNHLHFHNHLFSVMVHDFEFLVFQLPYCV
jgi:hypothetical protein